MIESTINWFNSISAERGVRRFIDFLRRRGIRIPQDAVDSFLAEPTELLSLSYQVGLGLFPSFTWYGLNPSELSEAQKHANPVLLLHGNNCNQGTWLSAAQYLQQNYPGPVFTVNLNNGFSHPDDKPIIENKIIAIQALYSAQNIFTETVHVVGHSRGANLAYFAAVDSEQWTSSDGTNIINANQCKLLKFRPDIGRVILMGGGALPPRYGSYQFLQDKFCAIMGEKDTTRHAKACMEATEEHRAVIPCGHAGMLMHPAALNKLGQWLNEAKDIPQELPSQEDRQVAIVDGVNPNPASMCVVM